jgi:S1-C subfamily serine protease
MRHSPTIGLKPPSVRAPTARVLLSWLPMPNRFRSRVAGAVPSGLPGLASVPRRLFLAATLIGVVAGCGGAPAHHRAAAATGQPEKMSAYDDAVRVETSSGCAAAHGGAGLTDGRFVLTTASVVAGARTVAVVNRQGQRVPARVVDVDPDADVAWLYAPGLPSRPTSPAQAGDHVAPAYVFAIDAGHGLSILRALSLERTTRTGADVYRSHAVTRQVYVLHLDHPAGIDVTGAPVLDEDGRLLGVALSGAAGDVQVVVLAGDAIARSPATVALRGLTDPSSAPAPVTRCVPSR